MKKCIKSITLVFTMLLLSKILALSKEALIAGKFAASYIIDAYTVVISLPSIIFAIFVSGFSNSYMPIFLRIEDEEKNSFFNNVFNVLLIISLLISILCFILSEKIIFLLAPGFDKKTIDIAVRFTKMIVFYFPFYILFNILSAHLQAKERFILSSFCNYILINVILLISIYLSSKKRINILIYGYVISGFLSFFILYLVLLIKKEIKYIFLIDLENDHLKNFIKISIPFGISSLINQINGMIDKMFSSTLEEGMTSSLNYANKIQLLPYSLIISITLSILSPKINKAFIKKNREDYLFYIKLITLFSLYISLPVVVILFIFSEQIIKLLLERGEFNSEITLIVANCLAYYSLGIPFYALREILNIIFIANNKQKLILKNTIISVVLNVVLNYFLIKTLNYKGLPLSTSLSGIISCLLMNNALRNLKLNLFSLDQLKEIFKILISSIIIGIFAIITYKNLCTFVDFKISIMISLSISGILYISITYFLKIKILVYFIKKGNKEILS